MEQVSNHLEAVDSSTKFSQINKVNLETDATICDIHNESDKLNHEILENQIFEQSSSTPEKIDEAYMIENSGSQEDPNHIQIQVPTVVDMQSFSNMVQIAQRSLNTCIKVTFHTEKTKQSDFEWKIKLKEQDAIWQRMFEENPKINLFPLCLEFFREVKQDMDDEILFNQWLENQKKKYPNRSAYQK